MKWWLRQRGRVTGPHEEAELRRKIETNAVNSMDEVSMDGVVWERVRRTALWQPLAAPERKAEATAEEADDVPRLRLKDRGGAAFGASRSGSDGWVFPEEEWSRGRRGMPRDGEGRPVGFLEAWKRGWTRWSWEGRASRSEYWWRMLSMLLEMFALGIADAMLFMDENFTPLSWLYQVALFVPRMGVLVRRLHDVGKSGWWVWISAIPLVGPIWLLVLTLTAGDAGPNEYGEVPWSDEKPHGGGRHGGGGGGHGGGRGYSFAAVLFGGVFERHPRGELGAWLGGAREQGVPRTWVWSRLVGVSAVLLACLAGVCWLDGNAKLWPAMIFVMAFAVPLGVLVFLLECDGTGKVSAWKALGIFGAGGVLSVVAMLCLAHTAGGEWMGMTLGAMSAGPLEETAKVACMAYFLRDSREMPWILNGVVVGAAVGAGFAALETAGYIFENLVELGEGAGWATAAVRAVTAPFAHVAWGAAEGGALCWARGERGTLEDAFGSKVFWGVFAGCVVLHALWNSGLVGIGGLISKLGVVVWLLVWHWLKKGFEQAGSQERSAWA